MIKRCLCFMALAIASVLASAADRVIRVHDANPNADYALAMLELALSHIDKDYRIETNSDDLSQARVREEVRSGGFLDLAYSSSGPEMEETLRPIRIPLFKGLLGYRIFIIHKDSQARFNQINTLEELKQLRVGQGLTWADTAILESNGFTVIKTAKYPNLFDMVDGGRFDAFPRGVHEPFAELASRPDLDLTVEQNLMLAYRMPYYFFVAKDNAELAQDLETGLNRAIEDGSFDELFINHKSVKDVIAKANMKSRQVFRIDNPLLSAETPLDRNELWFDPSQLP